MDTKQLGKHGGQSNEGNWFNVKLPNLPPTKRNPQSIHLDHWQCRRSILNFYFSRLVRQHYVKYVQWLLPHNSAAYGRLGGIKENRGWKEHSTFTTSDLGDTINDMLEKTKVVMLNGDVLNYIKRRCWSSANLLVFIESRHRRRFNIFIIFYHKYWSDGSTECDQKLPPIGRFSTTMLPSHTYFMVTDYLTKNDIATIPHPFYSPGRCSSKNEN